MEITFKRELEVPGLAKLGLGGEEEP